MKISLRCSALYKQTDVKKEPVDVVLDPNKLSKDGSIAVELTSFSEDGNWLAYGMVKSGSEWVSIKIRNVETLKDCKEVLQYVRNSAISWTHDNKGFFYSVCTYVK